jgi:hypothetical protein
MDFQNIESFLNVLSYNTTYPIIQYFRFKRNIFGIFEKEFQDQLTKDFQQDIYNLFDFRNPINSNTPFFSRFESDSPLTLLLLIYGKQPNHIFLLKQKIIKQTNIKIKLSQTILNGIHSSKKVKQFLKLQ